MWNFIKKNWKLLIGFIGGILGVIFLGNKFYVSPYIIPSKKEIEDQIKEEEKKTEQIKQNIKVIAEENIKAVENKTPEEINSSLSIETQQKIEDIKTQEVNNTFDRIIKRVKETQDGNGN